jgi:glycosyltransferase involved in cell wall biosynthesis
VRAANVVIFELIKSLAAQSGLRVGVLQVVRPGEPAETENERESRRCLEGVGVEVLPELVLPKSNQKVPSWQKFLFHRPEDFYPDISHAPEIAGRLREWGADALIVPWSEWLTAACSAIPITKFAYYGNPDHKTGAARINHDVRLDGPSWRAARVRLGLAKLEKAHVEIMRRYDLVGDVAANDAAYYAAKGHPNAFYIRNVWIDRFGPSWRARRDTVERNTPTIIIANVGKLDGTANRLGLDYLGGEVLPALRRRMPSGTFELKLLGAGKLHPRIQDRLQGADVTFTGFVDDIDDEILRAAIFLCVNNGTSFNVGHTRYLHAWSLGSCVVAHAAVSLAMPEIRHQENALLGNNAEAIAIEIARAASDRTLRRRIGEGGWRTYESCFRACVVAQHIARALAERPGVRIQVAS